MTTKPGVDKARLRLLARREAHEEFERLAKRYWCLRETMTAEAIAAMWILLGDKMFEGGECDGPNQA